MKKKSIMARVGVMAAALTLATTSMMSGTLAKYTTEASTTGKAIVANWGAIIKNGNNVVSETTDLLLAPTNSDLATMNLGKLETSGASAKTLVDKYTDGSAYYIAPGMSGSIPITIDMSGSQVATKYSVSIKLDDDSASLPFNMSIGTEATGGTGITPVTLTGNKKDPLLFGEVQVGSGIIYNKTADNASTQKATFNLKWDWPLTVNENNVAKTAKVTEALYNQWDMDYVKSVFGDGEGTYTDPSTLTPAVTLGADYNASTSTISKGNNSNTDHLIKLKITIKAEQATADDLPAAP